MHQESYNKKVLCRFKMEDVNAVAVPDQHHQMCADVNKNGHQEALNVPYRQVIGNLMYLSIGTRPDITFSVNSASQYLENPMKIHWNACKRILKYLKGTIDHGFYFPAEQKNHLQAFCDAD